MTSLKKAAMFGLDARIALAIFGTLSAISGAALYSAIQQAKSISIITELNEFLKAIESFMLDTGVDVPSYSGDVSGSSMMIAELVDNTSGISGWNGPYLSLQPVTDVGSTHHLQHSLHNQIHLGKGMDIAFDDLVDDGASPCTAGNTCYYWIQTQNTPCQQAYSVDEYVDGSLDNENGNVRVLVRPGGELCKIYLKGPPVLAQP